MFKHDIHVALFVIAPVQLPDREFSHSFWSLIHSPIVS